MAIDIELYLSSDLRTIAHPSPGSDFTNSSLYNMRNRLELAIVLLLCVLFQAFCFVSLCHWLVLLRG